MSSVLFPARPALPPPALPCPALRCAALPCPGLAWPGLAWPWPALPCPVLARRVALTGREGPGCLLEFVERPAQAARTHNPTPIHLSCALLCLVAYILNCARKQRARKPPLRGVWGVNPKPELRIVWVAGVGLHADASARLVGAPLFLK